MAKNQEDFVMVNGIKCTAAAPLVDIDKIIPYENNPKIHGSELEFLKNCIKNPEIGFCDPIEVDKDMIIVSGHGRRQAAIELGMEQVPCIIHRHMSGDASDAYRLQANRQSELSGYDFDKLNFELDKLTDLGWDMQSFGFEDMSQFDVTEPDQMEPMGETLDFVTESEKIDKEEYRIMVSLSSKSEQDELFEYLIRNGYDCQLLK